MERAFSRKLMPGDPNRQWDTTIVVSDNEAAHLPRSMKGGKSTPLLANRVDRLIPSPS